ncbi:unnamed protein product [Ectocarpus sp. 4 AP-2014]
MTGVALTVTDQNVDMPFPSGLQVYAMSWFTDPNYIGSVYVYAPLDMPTVGVLGTNNGNRADDWTASGPSHIPVIYYLTPLYLVPLSSRDSTGKMIHAGSPSIAEGYNHCTSNWKVEESLLTTPLRLRSRSLQTADSTAPMTPHVIPTDVGELCGDNPECIVDAIVVGLDVGAATLEADQEFEAEVQAAGGDVCQESTFSSDGLSPCTDCPEGGTSSRGAVVCEGTVSGPSTTTGFTPDSLGCYEDDREARILDYLALSDDSMTAEVTKSFADAARLVWTTLCTGSPPTAPTPVDGTLTKTCGGFYAANVYRLHG